MVGEKLNEKLNKNTKNRKFIYFARLYIIESTGRAEKSSTSIGFNTIVSNSTRIVKKIKSNSSEKIIKENPKRKENKFCFPASKTAIEKLNIKNQIKLVVKIRIILPYDIFPSFLVRRSSLIKNLNISRANCTDDF
jgi:hypothetical protein